MPNTARPQEGPGSTVARASLAPSIAFAILVVVIAMRNAGLYPAVFSDEYLYSTSARLKPLADATVPAWLYLAVYRLTATCGDGFLACARILNLAVFALASGFVYLVARRVANSGTAIAIALLALAGACNTFTAYFMREALYAFGFWVLVWHTTRLGPEASSRCWAVVGLMLGLLSLVKPHALFLLPPLMAHAVIVLWPALREHRGAVAARVSLVVAGTVAVLPPCRPAAFPAVTLYGAPRSSQRWCWVSSSS